MAAYITLDFSKLSGPGSNAPAKPTKLTRSRKDLKQAVEDSPRTDLESLPDINDTAPGTHGPQIPLEQVEAAKATFVASGGNISEVARTHNMTASKVVSLANKHAWPVYGQGFTSAEKSRKTRLMVLAEVLENKLFQLADAMGVETKQIDDVTEKGMNSRYVASLTQRSSAFSAVFDRYFRVMALLEPETFGHDDDPSNPVAAKIRQRRNRDALGGVDGIDKRMADFAARVAVSAIEASKEGSSLPAEIMDAEVVDDDDTA